jgi:hypothetical protein
MTTPSRGLGNAPFGVAAYAYGTPAVAPEIGGRVYRGTDGVVYGSRKLSSTVGSVGQYVYDSFGRAIGAPDVEQLVTIVVLMIRDSSVVKGLGHRFYEARYVTPSYPQEQETRVREAFADLVAKNYVRIDRIKVEGRNGMPAITRVQLHDLTRDVSMTEISF